MEKIRSIIVDDEAHNRFLLHTMLQEHCALVEIVAECGSADEAFDTINDLKPQLVFLDIKMPGKSGFDLLKMFSKINFEVIFVSGFDEYAITAFEFNALGYILKPIDYTKLNNAVTKVSEFIKLNKTSIGLTEFVKTIEAKTNIIQKISIHQGEKVVLVDISNVICVVADRGICYVYVVDNLKYVSTKDLKLFESILEMHGSFLRINKSVIINSKYMKSYRKGEGCDVEMINNLNFEVSRRKKAEVLSKLRYI